MDNIAFIIVSTVIFVTLGISLVEIFRKVGDESIILILILSELLFVPSTGTQFELKHLCIPVFTTLILLRSSFMQSGKKHGYRYLLPFLIYFCVGMYWFFVSGMLPNVLTGNENENVGNFIVFYNIFCNLCVLLIGFYSNIEKNKLAKIIKFIGVILLIQVLLMFLNKLLGVLQIPLLMPSGDSHIIVSAFSDMSRDGFLSHYCYLAAIFLSTSKRNIRRIAMLVLVILNLVYGGGRTDLIAIIVVGILSEMLETSSIRKSGLRLLSLTTFIVCTIFIGTRFMSSGQLNRFSDVFDPSKSEEMDKNKNGRMAMWLYSIQEFQKKPLLGNGISKQNNIGSGRTVAIRNVELGSSHQFYLSVLYAFGLSGFLPLLLGILSVLILLLRARKYDGYGLVNFVFILIFSYVFVQFMINGGVKKLFILFFLFLGMAPQLSRSSNSIDQV